MKNMFILNQSYFDSCDEWFGEVWIFLGSKKYAGWKLNEKFSQDGRQLSDFVVYFDEI